MDLSTLIGLVLGAAALLAAFVMEGGSPAALIGVTAAIIVFGGTIGALMISYTLPDVLMLPKLLMKAIKPPPDRRQWLIQELVTLAEIARRDGLLALESREIDDAFLKRATMLVVDGTDPEVTREILTQDVEAMAERHEHGYSILGTMGGFAPTMGIIGTVMGLINVLSSLKNPDELGPAIAVAFLATLYGVGSANLLWLPLHNKLKLRSQQEVQERMIVVEGALGLQSGDNPRVLREKLLAALPPKARAAPAPQTRPGEAPVAASAVAEGGE